MSLSYLAGGTAIVAAALAAAWWRGRRPSNERDWRPEVARLATAEVKGERVTVRNVRNFRYRSVEEFDERWEERSYDLAGLEGLDLFFIYWGAPLIAHTILSWSFADGQRLAISVETRKKKGQEYSAWKAFFRQYELVYVVADEEDVIKLRTNYRREVVYLYRVRTSRAAARALLLDYLDAINVVSRRPVWYNALVANCTTVIRDRVVHAGGRLPLSWQLYANAYLPELLYRRGTIDTSRPFAELKAMSRINERALEAETANGAIDFSARIRAGLPMPRLS
ncbi:MAG TPA: DUF4105 domain-containing protein [Burkholderiales bacterium]